MAEGLIELHNVVTIYYAAGMGKAQGKGYQSRINTVLRAYKEAKGRA
jgi:uncharacterized protein (DUF4415 family)